MTTSFTYDAVDQLLTESRAGYSASYTYDANGNRTSKTVGGLPEIYVYDLADKLLSTSTKSYGYDAMGRTTSVVGPGGTTTLTYDIESRVTSISGAAGSSNYTYNGLNTRVGKTDSTGTFTYKRDGAYVTDPVLSDGAATYTPGVSERRGGASGFNLSDYLGTNGRMVNAAGTTTGTRSYDAFGLLLSSTGSNPSPFGFAGSWGYQEDVSGLKLLGHRYYDASTGRFLSRDPIKDGRNWYAYAGGNPMAYVDADGLSPKDIVKWARNTVENADRLNAYNKKYNIPWAGTKKNTDCGFFVGHAARKHDPKYPRSGTAAQRAYVSGEGKKKWTLIRIEEDTVLQDGDIMWRNGHTEVHVGTVERYDKKLRKRRPYKNVRYGASLRGHTPMYKGSGRGNFTHIFRANADETDINR